MPQTALDYSPYGASVYKVIDADTYYLVRQDKARASGIDDETISHMPPPEDGKQLVVQKLFVQTGATRGDQVEILNGIASGDQIVTSGQLKLSNGTAIAINNALQPSSAKSPIVLPESVQDGGDFSSP